MMISPETFYKRKLEGKSPEQIVSRIRGLKNRIGYYKNVLESSDRDRDRIVAPSFSTRIKVNRLYLKRAKEALKEAGGSYQPSIREQKIADFNESIPLIEKIILRIGGFHQGVTVTMFILGDKEIQVKEKHIEDSDFQTIGHIRYEGTKEDFLKEFQTLHIGEWKRHYNDPDILDGTQWELEIFFTTKKALPLRRFQ